MALCAGHTSLVQALQRTGDLPDEALTSVTPAGSLLHLTAGLRQRDSFAWLLEQKLLDASAVTPHEGLTVLHCAVLGGHASIVQLALKAGASLKAEYAPAR